MLDLAARLSELSERRSRAPWAYHEHFKGWGVFGLPFDSGHVLALRVVPESDFGSYRTLWHRDPSGNWAIYVDGPRLDTACPRFYSKALTHTGFAHIELDWTAPDSLHISMDRPHIDWSLTARTTLPLEVLNVVSARLPLSTWRPRVLVHAREVIASWLGMGRLEFAAVMPNGQSGTVMPQQIYFIDRSTAVIDGADLGLPIHARENPTIGSVPLPARGVLATGRAILRIADIAAYEQTVAEVSGSPSRMLKNSSRMPPSGEGSFSQ